MNHIHLDAEDDHVKRFFQSLPIGPGGAVLELAGQAVACILPAGDDSPDNDREEWTEAKNSRRCALIDREIDGTLQPEEILELHLLQREMLRYRRRVAPLPLDDARNLYRDLLAKSGLSSSRE